MKMGKLIVFEGPDTSGKTTTINKLKTALPIIFEKESFIFTREPGNLIANSNNTSEKIRKILLTNSSLKPLKQAELFAIAREYHVKDIIRKLKAGKNVIVDRFILSSLVYQGIDLGYDKVISLNKSVLDLLRKEKIEIHNIVLHINKDTYNKRMSRKEKDAMELVDEETINKRIAFHENLEFLEKLHIGKIYHVNANNHSEDTVMQTLNHIYGILNN